MSYFRRNGNKVSALVIHTFSTDVLRTMGQCAWEVRHTSKVKDSRVIGVWFEDKALEIGWLLCCVSAGFLPVLHARPIRRAGCRARKRGGGCALPTGQHKLPRRVSNDTWVGWRFEWVKNIIDWQLRLISILTTDCQYNFSYWMGPTLGDKDDFKLLSVDNFLRLLIGSIGRLRVMGVWLARWLGLPLARIVDLLLGRSVCFLECLTPPAVTWSSTGISRISLQVWSARRSNCGSPSSSTRDTIETPTTDFPIPHGLFFQFCICNRRSLCSCAARCSAAHTADRLLL